MAIITCAKTEPHLPHTHATIGGVRRQLTTPCAGNPAKAQQSCVRVTLGGATRDYPVDVEWYAARGNLVIERGNKVIAEFSEWTFVERIEVES